MCEELVRVKHETMRLKNFDHDKCLFQVETSPDLYMCLNTLSSVQNLSNMVVVIDIAKE